MAVRNKNTEAEANFPGSYKKKKSAYEVSKRKKKFQRRSETQLSIFQLGTHITFFVIFPFNRTSVAQTWVPRVPAVPGSSASHPAASRKCSKIIFFFFHKYPNI